tara:strand:+ start:5630 stop:6025 length:396 start_codon:yes stop_codon:yes gene_type:complete
MALTWEDKLKLMAMGGNPGGIPNAPYDAPKEDPKNPWVPAPKRDKLQAQVNYGSPTERDKWLQLYQGPGGTLRHVDPDLRKLILHRGAMKADLPANNIRSTSPWRTRPKEGTNYREFYDPLTGMSRDDFKA